MDWSSLDGVPRCSPYSFADGYVYDLVNDAVLSRKKDEIAALEVDRQNAARAIVWAGAGSSALSPSWARLAEEILKPMTHLQFRRASLTSMTFI